jgi:pimeloyl-ACP methyl ester carboxylesterase
LPYFDYGGKKVYFNTYGKKGPFLLMLHAGAMSSRMFLKEISRFYEKHYRVYTFDYIGCGKSKKAGPIPDNYWVENARVAAALSKRLGVDSAFVIGTDAGASVALNLSILEPGLVKKAVCDGFFGTCIEPSLAEMIRSARETSKKGLMAFAWFITHGFKWKETVDSDTEKVIKICGSGEILAGELKNVKCPVLFTAGNPDPAIPETEKKLAEYASLNPAFSFKLMSKPCHMAMLYDNYNFSRFVRGFFNSSSV